MHNIEIPHNIKLLSLIYVNACCLNENFDDQHLVSCTQKNFCYNIATSQTSMKQLSRTCSLKKASF